jgi:hypothetical protein
MMVNGDGMGSIGQGFAPRSVSDRHDGYISSIFCGKSSRKADYALSIHFIFLLLFRVDFSAIKIEKSD